MYSFGILVEVGHMQIDEVISWIVSIIIAIIGVSAITISFVIKKKIKILNSQ